MSTFADLAALTIHDVKNRLALVAARAEAGGDAETLRGVLESAATLTRLLAWYKAEEGALGVDVDARVPADLVVELATEMRHQTTLTVVEQLDDAPSLAFYDEALIRMVLLDALYNACRHARSQLVLSASADGDWLVFAVRDDGDGYPESLLSGSPAMQPISRRGTGLGLHLACRIAALHTHHGRQGQVALRNDPGALFELRLPL